jgi:peptidyl-tRNA hydrolase
VGAPAIKAIIGLGNPGPRYRHTRHNIGWQVIDLLAKRWRAAQPGKARHAEVARAAVGGETVLLVKPTTFMNDSGLAVRALVEKDRIHPGDLLVVYDDLDLAIGRIRLRAGGSSGGHNGIRSIQQHLGQIKGRLPLLRPGALPRVAAAGGAATVALAMAHGEAQDAGGPRGAAPPASAPPDAPPAADPAGFARLKVGIGRPPPGVDPIDHVLTSFTPDERVLMDAAVERAAGAAESWLNEGIFTAMNRFNGG